MQLILWHDAANGRKMRWATAMQEREQSAVVDITAEMKQALCNADQDFSED